MDVQRWVKTASKSGYQGVSGGSPVSQWRLIMGSARGHWNTFIRPSYQKQNELYTASKDIKIGYGHEIKSKYSHSVFIFSSNLQTYRIYNLRVKFLSAEIMNCQILG